MRIEPLPDSIRIFNVRCIPPAQGVSSSEDAGFRCVVYEGLTGVVTVESELQIPFEQYADHVGSLGITVDGAPVHKRCIDRALGFLRTLAEGTS